MIDSSRQRILAWWPSFVGGLLLPVATFSLEKWMPVYLAWFFAFSVLFASAALVYVRHPPVPGWSLARWLQGAVLGGVVAAAIAAAFPWQ